MVSLTHLLIWTMSFQAFGVSTTSRASSALVSHSPGYSEQNSSQPIGARATGPTDTNNGRSPAVSADASAAPKTRAPDKTRAPCTPRDPNLGPPPFFGGPFSQKNIKPAAKPAKSF